MPLSKSYQQSGKPRTSSRRACHLCHNLNPRGHPSTIYEAEGSKRAASRLTLVVDGLELQKSQKNGCRFCDILAQALDGFWKTWRTSRRRVMVDIEEKGPVRVALDDPAYRGSAIELSSLSNTRSPWPTLGRTHPIPSNAGSDETFDFVRRCIRDCLVNPKHSNCKSFIDGNHPKRLLDVGRSNQAIRVVEVNEQRLQYASLSHCWGTGPTLTTTKSNWRTVSRNIPFDALPALFQDAVIITRQLGLQYLWIDSLCIIQDSTRDWETESAKMAAIYENSYVTIAATESGDHGTRCLVPREKALKLTYSNTRKEEFHLKARILQEHHPDDSQCKPAEIAGRLSTRAWALQEHVLSTRVLHYTKTEVLFECKTSFRCECTPARRSHETTPAILPKAIAKKKKDKSALWLAWHKIVSEYSKREITVPSDELPAISGVAYEIQRATSSEYIAGLWRKNLVSDLLWSTSSDRNLRDKPTALDPWRAPSFSWASVKAPVTYYEPDEDEREMFQSKIEIIEPKCKLRGLNPLGAISDGSITLRGPVVEAMLVSSEDDAAGITYQILIKGNSAIQMTPDCLVVEADMYASWLLSFVTTPVKIVRRAKLGETHVPFKASVLCLGVASYDGWISGLVLSMSEREKGAYERLGTFSAGTEGFQKAESKEMKLV